jgi:hypothetical protein
MGNTYKEQGEMSDSAKDKATKPRKKPGRPRIEFDEKVADRICEQIMDGKSLRRICTQKAMPTKKTVLRWLEENPSFASQYARAREEQAEGYADELIELAKKANAENAHAIRVRADIIKWACSKLKPKKYGDRIDVGMQADVTVRESADIGELARRHAFMLAESAENAPLDRFVEAQVEVLRHVAAQIRIRGGGPLTTRSDSYEGTFADIARAIEDIAKIVAMRLNGENALPAPKALPASAQERQEKEINPAPVPPHTEPTTRAREDDGDVIDGDAVVI